MTSDPHVDASENPYAAPAADLGEPSTADLVVGSPAATRRACIRREKAIKRLAWVNLFVAIIWTPAATGSLFFLALSNLRRVGVDIAPSMQLPPTMPTGGGLFLLAVFHVGIFSLSIALLLGLRTFRSWARWLMTAVAVIVLVSEAVAAYHFRPGVSPTAVVYGGGAFLIAVMIYVLLSPPSGKVFTREYRDVVAQTRGMRF